MNEKTVEMQIRLDAAREGGVPWKKWGPYLSERQWGTVREDYSQDGNACRFLNRQRQESFKCLCGFTRNLAAPGKHNVAGRALNRSSIAFAAIRTR
jgi:hypothetical protein